MIDALTFTRASARTHPTTGAEVASGVPVVETYTDIVPLGIEDVAGLNGSIYMGQLADARYVYRASAGGLHTTLTGEPPLTLWLASVMPSVITPSGSLLRSDNQEPAHIYRRSAADGYAVETLVLTVNRGFPAWNSAYGATFQSSGMSYASDGATLWLGEYSNTAAIKNSADPPTYLWRSNDDGATWVNCYHFSTVDNTHMHNCFYDSITGTLYVAIGDNPSTTIGIWKSTDRGDTFTQVAHITANGLTVQPVSALRVGSYIYWGGDESPTGIWQHDPVTDAVTKIPFDYEDVSLITWNGVTYWLARLGDFLIAGTSQGGESSHRLYAAHTDDLTKWYSIAEMSAVSNPGWSRMLPLANGALLVKPSDSLGTPATVKIAALVRQTWQAIRLDSAVATLTPETTPLDSAWTISTGAYVAAGGPSGMRSVKLGDIRRQNLVCAAGDVVEYTAWLRNSVALGSSAFFIFEATFINSGGGTIQNVQRSVGANLLDTSAWQQWIMRAQAPANTVKVNLRLLISGFTYNVSTAYLEASGVSATLNSLDSGVETHARAAEGATHDATVGSAWSVFTSCWTAEDTLMLTTNKSLMRVTDRDSGAYWEVQYNASSKALQITDGSAVIAGATVRSLGAPRRGFYTVGSSNRRSRFGQPDFLAFGVRMANGAAELVVWDKVNRTVQTYSAGAFSPSRLRVTFPASGAAYAPTYVGRAVADADLFSHLMRAGLAGVATFNGGAAHQLNASGAAAFQAGVSGGASLVASLSGAAALQATLAGVAA